MSLRNKLTIGLVSIVAIVTMTTSVAAYLSTAHRLRAVGQLREVIRHAGQIRQL